MTERTVACPICGDPYVIYDMYAGDQSACPMCRAEARGYQWTGSEWVRNTIGTKPEGE